MDNYWYISLNHHYPKPMKNQQKRVVMSVQIKKGYSIIEMTREATPQEMDYCKLVYCGHGCWNDKHVQENIRRVSYYE